MASGRTQGRNIAAQGFRLNFDPAAMAKLLEDIDGPVGKDIQRRTIQVERAAKRLCPVDTGRLRASITSTVAVDAQGLYGIVGTNVTYAAHVEFGTRNMAARPFLRPALADAAGALSGGRNRAERGG
jgi:HK97 gp10 family phage protein